MTARDDESTRDDAHPHRHESVDHVDPTDEGLMEPTGGETPGTDIFGDETNVRDLPDGRVPGLYPGAPAHTGGAAHPGPTPAEAEDKIERATGE